MKNEMDSQVINLVDSFSSNVLEFIHMNLTESEKYRKVDVVLNVLIISLFKVIYSATKDKKIQEEVIQKLLVVLRENFEANREINEGKMND
jgi:hypothetical protein